MKYVIFSVLVSIGILVTQSKTKIVFFGDSITEQGAKPGGFITRIDSMYKLSSQSRYDFVGAGVGGNKVYDLYLRLDDDVLKKNPSAVVIYIGVNDVWHKSTTGTGTDPDKFEKFYDAILKKFRDNNIKVIICTPAVIGEKTDFSNRQDGDMNNYSNIIRSIAKRNNLPLVDLRQKFLDYDLKNNPENKESGILTVDGVHLNARGNQLVAEEILKAIEAL